MEVKNYAASFYVGRTTRGIESAVFFDPNFASFNNQSPVTLITGSPGSGKTFFAQTICAQSAISGKMTVVIDPKADFISMLNIEDDVGDVTLIQLSEKSRRGIIDPFVICGEDKGQGITLAKELITVFTGEKNLPIEAIDPICSDVAEMENPCFTLVMEKMRSFNRPGDESFSQRVRGLGVALKTMSRLPYARLAFADPHKVPPRVSMKQGLTVITMLGLDLPNAEMNVEDYSQTNRLASGMMFLIADYVSRVMREETLTVPKLLIIDEAWSVIKNKAGAKVVQDVSLLGRSLNISLVMITQNAGHLTNLDISNAITTFFGFRTNGKEGNKVAALMGLRDSPDADDERDFIDLMNDLDNGECLMKDVRQRFATVQITRYKEDWAKAFETNPLSKDPNKGKRRKKKIEEVEPTI